MPVFLLGGCWCIVTAAVVADDEKSFRNDGGSRIGGPYEYCG